MTAINSCPLTGQPGKLRRSFSPEQLVNLYSTYLGVELPETLISKYFKEVVHEFESAQSGMRWYKPAIAGESDLYEFLGKTFEWYYHKKWDFFQALEALTLHCRCSFADVGCGSGVFLEAALQSGLTGFGIEINRDVVNEAQRAGKPVYEPHAIPADTQAPDTLCFLQVLEHVPEPVSFVQSYISRFQPNTLIISTPCFEGLLGRGTDPLSWPPHHCTAWSARGFETLASILGYKVASILREPSSFEQYSCAISKETTKRLDGAIPIPAPLLGGRTRERVGRALFSAFKLAGFPWARFAHSIIAVLQRPE